MSILTFASLPVVASSSSSTAAVFTGPFFAPVFLAVVGAARSEEAVMAAIASISMRFICFVLSFLKYFHFGEVLNIDYAGDTSRGIAHGKIIYAATLKNLQ